MNSKDFLKEGFVEDAQQVAVDHEVQMAREELYHAAEHAIALHKLLRHVSEQQGLEGWVSSKITLANDYLKTVREYLEYELMTAASSDPAVANDTQLPVLPVAEGQNPISQKKERELIKRGILPRGDEVEHYRKQMGRAGKISTRQMRSLEKGKRPGGPNERDYANRMHADDPAPMEDALGTSPDRLLARTGINIAHKQPRAGQTKMGNIPVGNLEPQSASSKQVMNKLRAERPAALKAAIKGQLGQHRKPNLPEGGNDPVDTMQQTGDKPVKYIMKNGKRIGEVGIDSTYDSEVAYYGKLYDGSRNSSGHQSLKDAASDILGDGDWDNRRNRPAPHITIVSASKGKMSESSGSEVKKLLKMIGSTKQDVAEGLGQPLMRGAPKHLDLSKAPTVMSNHLFDKRYTDTNGPAFEVDTKFGLKKDPRVKNSETLVGNKSSQQHPTWEEPWFYQGARNQQEVQELKQMARELNLLVQMNGGMPLVQRKKLSPSAQLRKDQADWRADDRGDPDLRETQQDVAETNVSKYADMGATNSTTHFIKNITTGKIVSPHRSRQDAEDALVANMRDSDNEFKIVRARKEGTAEATGDAKFDKMLKGITAKKAVAKQRKADTQQQARDAFGGMFGGGNPADKLGLGKKDVSEAQPTRRTMPWSVWNAKSADDQRFIRSQYPDLVITDRPRPKSTAAPKKEKIDYAEIARKIQEIVGNTFPDGDPIDWLIPYMRRRWGQEYNIGQHLDRAARRHLGARDYTDYLAQMWDQVADDNLMPDHVTHDNNPWRAREGVAEGSEAWTVASIDAKTNRATLKNKAGQTTSVSMKNWDVKQGDKLHGSKDKSGRLRWVQSESVADQGVAEGQSYAVDNLLSLMRKAMAGIDASSGYSDEGRAQIRKIYNGLRHPLMRGNMTDFEKTWEYAGSTAPDAFDVFADELFAAAGMPEGSTYDEFMQSLNNMQEGWNDHIPNPDNYREYLDQLLAAGDDRRKEQRGKAADTAQLTKPTPSQDKSVNENASGGASSAGAVAGVNNPASKKAKSKIGSLFGGTYKQSKAKK